MEAITKTQSLNENVLEKCIKIVFTLISDHTIINKHILKSEILGKLGSFIEQHPDLKQENLALLAMISDLVYEKGSQELFITSGLVNLMAEMLRIKQLKAVNAATIIDQLTALHTSKILRGAAYTKVFSGLMARL
jgi:hypothetical protein